eukprot:scaffold6865_cov417-Prasinococcus_capsulatus_cf.AAC.2
MPVRLPAACTCRLRAPGSVYIGNEPPSPLLVDEDLCGQSRRGSVSPARTSCATMAPADAASTAWRNPKTTFFHIIFKVGLHGHTCDSEPARRSRLDLHAMRVRGRRQLCYQLCYLRSTPLVGLLDGKLPPDTLVGWAVEKGLLANTGLSGAQSSCGRWWNETNEHGVSEWKYESLDEAVWHWP